MRFLLAAAIRGEYTALPAYNLFGSAPTLSMMKGYFLVLAPLSRGIHTLHASVEFPAFPFQAGGVTYTIVVR